VVGLAALAAFFLAGLRNPVQFFAVVSFAFVFWIGLPLGCTALRLIHNLVERHMGIPSAPPPGISHQNVAHDGDFGAFPFSFACPCFTVGLTPPKLQADDPLAIQACLSQRAVFHSSHGDLLLPIWISLHPALTSGRGSRMKRAKPG
jgi:hypothetical protein